MSGKRDDRPSYQAMLADARQLRAAGKPVVIVVKWLHRLGRRVLERVRCREEIKDIGVTLHSIAEGGELSDLVANILASVAEEEVRQLGERIQAVNQHLVQTGWARPGRPPWGYQFRPATSEERASGSAKAVLDVNPAAAPFVQEAFNRVARGDGLCAVMRWVELLPSSARGGKVLSRVTVRHILQSTTYIAHVDVDGALLPAGGRRSSTVQHGIEFESAWLTTNICPFKHRERTC
jgi:DNA invertase Pin-like site-specific DNA recombinase